MKTDPLLRLMLTIVPELDQLVRRGHFQPGVYDTAEEVLEKYGTDDQREWSDLAQICRQERALLASSPGTTCLRPRG